MADKGTVKSLKIFLEDIEKGFKSEAEFDRSFYTFVRDYVINYFNRDKNTSLKEKFAEYKLSDIYKGSKREDKKKEMIDIEMDIGNMGQKENSEGIETATVINLIDDDNPLSFEIDNDLKYKLYANYSKDVKKEAAFEVVRNLAYTAEKWKINEELKDYKLKHNALTLKEIMEYSNASVREKVYGILGNGENVKNRIVRDAGVRSIGEATSNTLRADELIFNKKVRKKSEEIVSKLKSENKNTRNGYLVEAIEELQDRRNEEIYEKTRVLSDGIEYEISQEEELISSYPELLDVYPALRYKFNENGTRKTTIEEVNYGLDKINDMIENTNEKTGNEEALEGKVNQVYDLINEDFVYALSNSNNKEKFMMGFISSIGLDKSKEYLTQVQKWQKNKDKIEQKENQEIEKNIETEYKKVVVVNTDLEKADDFINEVARKLYEKDKSTVTIKYANKDIESGELPQIEEVKEITENKKDIYIDLEDYIDNLEDYELTDEELEEFKQEQAKEQDDRKNKAVEIYEDKKKEAIKKDPEISTREEQVVDDIKQKSKRFKEREEIEQLEQPNSIDDKENAYESKEEIDNEIDTKELENNEENSKQYKTNEIEDKIYPEEDVLIEDNPIVENNISYQEKPQKQDNEIIEEQPKFEIESEEIIDENKRTITGYTTGKYSNGNIENKFEDGKDGQRNIKMPDGSIKNEVEVKLDDFKDAGKYQSKIENVSEEITKENQMNIDEWKEEKERQEAKKESTEKDLTKEEAEYRALKTVEEKAKYLEEHIEFRTKKAQEFTRNYNKVQLKEILNDLREVVEKNERILYAKMNSKDEVDKLHENVSSFYERVTSLNRREK